MAETALKNMLDPGTHRCTWTLSKPPDTWSWEVAGDVELLAQRQPRGGVYGKAPADWAVSPSGRGRPQRGHSISNTQRSTGNWTVDLMSSSWTLA